MCAVSLTIPSRSGGLVLGGLSHGHHVLMILTVPTRSYKFSKQSNPCSNNQTIKILNIILLETLDTILELSCACQPDYCEIDHIYCYVCCNHALGLCFVYVRARACVSELIFPSRCSLDPSRGSRPSTRATLPAPSVTSPFDLPSTNAP